MKRLLFVMLFMLASCSDTPAELSRHDDVQYLPAEMALVWAQLWSRQGNDYVVTQPDVSRHSMGDAILEGDILRLQRYPGHGHIPKYSIVSRDDGVLHRVLDETEDAAFMSGDGNHYSDGWIAKTRIHWLSAAPILRSTGQPPRLPTPPNRG